MLLQSTTVYQYILLYSTPVTIYVVIVYHSLPKFAYISLLIYASCYSLLIICMCQLLQSNNIFCFSQPIYVVKPGNKSASSEILREIPWIGVMRISSEWVMRNSLELVLINSREIISRKSTALPLYGVHRCSSQEFLFLRKFSKISQISVDIFVGLSRDRFLGFFADSWERFLRISADYPQNCYLRSALFCLYLYCTACSGQLKSGPVLELNGSLQ